MRTPPSPNTHTDPRLVADRTHLSEKQILSIFIITAMLMLGAAVSYAAEWPLFRGPNGNGISPDARINMDWNAKPPAVLWTFRMSDSGWSNPAVGDNKVFVIDHVTSESKDAEGKVTGQKGEDMVRALDMKTGIEIWSFAYPGMPQERYGTTGPSPALNDGKLYTVSRNMLVHCLDAKTGRQIWERDCAKDFDARPAEVNLGHNASPLVDENRLILIPGGLDAAVVALDKNTGATLWKAPGSNAGHASPIAYGSGKSKQYIAFIGEGLVGLNPETGARLWVYEWKTTCNQNSATPLAIGNRIFFVSAWKMGAGLLDISNVSSPTLVWKNKEAEVRFSSPVYLNGNIYCTSMPENPGYLLCLNAETGAINWKQPGFNFGPLSAAGGALIAVAGKTGDVVLIEPSSAAYKELGRIHPSEPTTAWNAAIVVDGRMYVRTKKMLTCYDVVP